MDKKRIIVHVRDGDAYVSCPECEEGKLYHEPQVKNTSITCGCGYMYDVTFSHRVCERKKVKIPGVITFGKTEHYFGVCDISLGGVGLCDAPLHDIAVCDGPFHLQDKELSQAQTILKKGKQYILTLALNKKVISVDIEIVQVEGKRVGAKFLFGYYLCPEQKAVTSFMMGR